MSILGFPQQYRAQERPACQIEWPARLLGENFLHTSVAPGLVGCGEISYMQRDGLEGTDDLHGSVGIAVEDRAQRFMPADDLVECPFEGQGVKLALKPHGSHRIVNGFFSLQLVEEP